MKLEDVVPLRLADFAYPPGHPLAGRAGVVYAFAVRHTAGVVLVDTGIGTGDVEIARAYQPRVADVLDALRGHGIRREDVVAVVNTHLHFDHCGQNRRFAGLPIFVQQAEYEATLRPLYTVPEWVEFPGAAYRLLRGDAELLPGVRILATPGHTVGHQAVLVETGEGPLVIAGHETAERFAALRPRRVLRSHEPPRG